MRFVNFFSVLLVCFFGNPNNIPLIVLKMYFYPAQFDMFWGVPESLPSSILPGPIVTSASIVAMGRDTMKKIEVSSGSTHGANSDPCAINDEMMY